MCIYPLFQQSHLGTYSKDTKRHGHEALLCKTIHNSERLEPTQVFFGKGLAECTSPQCSIRKLEQGMKTVSPTTAIE